jgi:cytochrome c5
MKSHRILASGLLFALFALPFASQAGEGDLKHGRIYYRMVCTACHVQKASSIAPSKMSKAEWAAYIKADKHAKGKDSLKQYVGTAYRNSIKAGNKAAEKFADLPDAELLDDIKAFVEYGAKDGEKPASCS